MSMSFYLVIAALLFSFPGGPCQPEKPVEATAELMLTDAQPLGRIQIPSSVRSAPVPFLEIPISRIANPEEMGFSVFVYLEWTRPDSGGRAAEKVLLGNFTPYPADQPGVFMLRASKGFEKLKEMGANLNRDQVVLLLELKRIHPDKPWTSVQVTAAPARWRSEL
jgi:hypothetical protein